MIRWIDRIGVIGIPNKDVRVCSGKGVQTTLVHVGGNAGMVRKLYLDLEVCFPGNEMPMRTYRVDQRRRDSLKFIESGRVVVNYRLLIIGYKAIGMKPS